MLGNTDNVDEMNDQLVDNMHEIGHTYFCSKRAYRQSKLSATTLTLMEERRNWNKSEDTSSSAYKALRRKTFRAIRRDIRLFNTERIQEAIQQNKGSKVFAKHLTIGQSQLTKLKNDAGHTVNSKPEILKVVEEFYRSYTLQIDYRH